MFGWVGGWADVGIHQLLTLLPPPQKNKNKNKQMAAELADVGTQETMLAISIPERPGTFLQVGMGQAWCSGQLRPSGRKHFGIPPPPTHPHTHTHSHTHTACTHHAPRRSWLMRR